MDFYEENICKRYAVPLPRSRLSVLLSSLECVVYFLDYVRMFFFNHHFYDRKNYASLMQLSNIIECATTGV